MNYAYRFQPENTIRTLKCLKVPLIRLKPKIWNPSLASSAATYLSLSPSPNLSATHHRRLFNLHRLTSFIDVSPPPDLVHRRLTIVACLSWLSTSHHRRLFNPRRLQAMGQNPTRPGRRLSEYPHRKREAATKLIGGVEVWLENCTQEEMVVAGRQGAAISLSDRNRLEQIVWYSTGKCSISFFFTANLASSPPPSVVAPPESKSLEATSFGLVEDQFVDASLRLICYEEVDGRRFKYLAPSHGAKFNKGSNSIRVVTLQSRKAPADVSFSFSLSTLVELFFFIFNVLVQFASK